MLYEAQKHILKKFTLITKPRVCLTTDTWTSSNEFPLWQLKHISLTMKEDYMKQLFVFG